MEIRQIEFFLSIVDTGSFSAAADEHYISQSSLSKKIIALEKELGVTLFDRSKRKVFLTDAGETFLKHARTMYEEHKAMIVDLDGYKSDSDFFSIAAIPVIAQYGITTYIAEFREAHPHIQLSLEEIDGWNILPALEERRFDLAFTRHNFLDSEKFASLEIRKDKLLVVVSKKHQYATRVNISIKELSDDNFIVFDRVTDLHRLIIEECKNAGFDPIIFFSSHRKSSVLGLVGANIGLALMPTIIYDFHKTPDVVAIPLEEHIECNIVLAYLKNRKLPQAAGVFIGFFKEYLAKPLVAKDRLIDQSP